MNTQKDKIIDSIDSGNASDAMVEEQIAHNIVNLLDNHAQRLASPEALRLSSARSLAVSRVTQLQAEAASHTGINQSGNVLQWFGHHRATSAALFIGFMLVALFAMQQFGGLNHNLENSDAFLLASDLPPEAYADKGFNTWVDSN